MQWFDTKYKQNDTKDRTASFTQAEKRENIKTGEKHSIIFGKIAKFFADLKEVAFSGSYNDLKDKPSSFSPSSHKHTKSEITNFPSSMPASDVSAWAKAANKPSYNWSEIGNKPSSFTPSSHSHSEYAASSHNHSYLPLSGGTLSGKLYLGHIQGTQADRLYVDNGLEAGHMTVMPDANYGYGFFLGSKFSFTNNVPQYPVLYCTQSTGGFDIYPDKNETCVIGSPTHKMCAIYTRDIYNSSGLITSSDRNKKKDFESISSEFARKIIDGLIPTSFLYKDGTSGRRHYGLIAQDVEKLLKEFGIDSNSFAPLIKDWPNKEIINEDGGANTYIKDYDTEPEYYLRYEGFIGIIIKYIQSLNDRISTLESDNKSQEERLAKLESSLNT